MQKILLILVLFFFSIPEKCTAQKNIGIFAFKCSTLNDPWDPDSINSGITGSEEAIIYIAKELALSDYNVTVIADHPVNSRYSLPQANPRYIRPDAHIDKKFDIGIVWRIPQYAEHLKNVADKLYLWPHDTLCQQLSDKQVEIFEDVLWISQWQRQQWISVNPGFAKFNKIFGNGIVPDQFKPVEKRENPYSCIYGSNYARGLEILLLIWPTVKEKYPNATLDIYYGWQHYGLLTSEKVTHMQSLTKKLEPLGVKEHGLVGHEELNRAYERSSFWTYPCIAPETFCITAIRAQLAGAVPVIIEGTALPETVRHGYKCNTPQEYLQTLLKAMENAESISVEDRKKMGDFILDEYTWKSIAAHWKKLFDLSVNK